MRTTPELLPADRATAPRERDVAVVPTIDRLLASGGDARLALTGPEGLNQYGCSPAPRPRAIAFASATGESISVRGYAAAQAALRALPGQALADALDPLVEAQRRELETLFGWRDMACDIVFSPSGTDTQLLALFVAQNQLAPRELCSIVVAADETGSGAVHSVVGRHFSTVTARGVAVQPGAPVDGLHAGTTSVRLPLRDAQGERFSADELDRQVLQAVARACDSGKAVLLHVMEHSKLGLRCPSEACVDVIRQRWPGAVLVAVDACQFRSTGSRLGQCLARGDLVLVTGSKFFGGPGFCGALLLPPALSRRMAALQDLPRGLLDYACRTDWPVSWSGIRRQFTEAVNVGQYLRWAAALQEMRDYCAVPPAVRQQAHDMFAQTVPRLIGASPQAVVLASSREPEAGSPGAGTQVQTIFPFLVQRNGRPLDLAEAKTVYRALNQDLSALARDASSRAILRQVCHIAQPVALPGAAGTTLGALRICNGARLVSGSWLAAGEAGWQADFLARVHDVSTVMRKIELIVSHFSQLADPVRPAR